MTSDARQEVTITFCAAAGLGLQTAEDLARQMLSHAGFYVFSTREYMSRVRGGNNSTQFRVSRTPVRAPVERIDILFVLSPGLHANVTENITADTRVFGDASIVSGEIAELGFRMKDLELARRAKELGGAYYASTIVAGFIAGLFHLPGDIADELIAMRFRDRPDAIDGNRRAFRTGHEMGLNEQRRESLLAPGSAEKQKKTDEIFLDGNTALSLGAAAAGCNYVAAYPMSPGSGLFTYFAKHAEDFDAVVEQVEDEIAAINMAIGAGYAGARSLVTTSGGGYALMTEGISLAGITETPVVLHLAQRPGPATGLATRTEQGDLELALHAGHGDFPRPLLAPVNVESAFRLGARAFHLAQRFQTPTTILSDQYLLDSGYDVERPAPEAVAPPVSPIPAEAGYMRYAFQDVAEAASPFSVPGCGKGFVTFDSHEHTEDGHITEDRTLRRRMVEKRLAKGRALQREALAPIVLGTTPARTTLVCWGSTFEPLREAWEILKRDGREGLAVVACEQVNPLADTLLDIMHDESHKIFVEGNATGQFASVCRLWTGVEALATILKYDGFPFSADELARKIGEILDAPDTQNKT